MVDQVVRHASSTGQGFTDGTWLDVHFEAARPEYEAQFRDVGIQPGWRVLDAACGSGSFLPTLAELVGPGGGLAALDLAAENVAMVEQRPPLPCPVDARTGTVLDLPYADDSFDAVWFANTSQYLINDELSIPRSGDPVRESVHEEAIRSPDDDRLVYVETGAGDSHEGCLS